MHQVIWIDDGAGYMLSPLVRMLSRRGFNIEVYTSYQEAVSALEIFQENNKDSQEPLPDVISDLVIPRSENGTLDSLEVGFKLVRRSALLGARKIVIFSVVSKVRVSVEFSRLQEEFGATKFFFLEKTAAGPKVLVDTIASYLRSPEEQGGNFSG